MLPVSRTPNGTAAAPPLIGPMHAANVNGMQEKLSRPLTKMNLALAETTEHYFPVQNGRSVPIKAITTG